MDKQEYRELLDEIKYEYESGNYKKVISCANAIDIRKIREPRVLEIVSAAYEHFGQIDKAKDVLLAAYDSGNLKRQVVYKLCELSVQKGEINEAIGYYEDFRAVAPKDNNQYLLKYKIGRAGGASLQQLIGALETYNNREDDEQWKYELACLYHEAGEAEKCVSTCDEIFLWYGDGEYVKKALELKNSYTALTNAQQRKYEEMMQEFLKPEEMSPEIPLYNAEDDSIAEEFANEFLGERTPKIEEAMLQESIQLNGGEIGIHAEEVKPQIQEPEEPETVETEPVKYENEIKEEFEEAPDDEFIIKSRATKKTVMDDNDGDTCVISLAEIRKELDEEFGEPQCDNGAEYEDELPEAEQCENIIVNESHIGDIDENESNDENEADLGITTRITLAQLREMLKEDNIDPDDDSENVEEPVIDEETAVIEEIGEEITEPTEIELDAEETAESVATEPETEETAESVVAEPETEEVAEPVASEPETEKIAEPAVAEPVADESEVEEIKESVVPVIPVPVIIPEITEAEVVNVSKAVLAKLGMTELKKSSYAARVKLPDLHSKATFKNNIEEAPVPAKNVQIEPVQDLVAVERLKQIQQAVDIESKVVLPYSMDDPSFENIEMEEYTAQESDADKAIAAFDKIANEEPDVESDDLAAIGDSLVAMIGAEAIVESQDDYMEYDNHEEDDEAIKPEKNNSYKPTLVYNYQLSENNRDEMSEFLLIDGMEEQICAAIGQILEDRRQGKRFGGNLVVTGDAKSGKTYLAIAVIKAIAEELESGDGKVAKVQAEALNGKSLTRVFSKIIGSDLVIENVGNLSNETIEDLIGVLKTGKLENMVVLEGNQLAVDNIFTNYPELGRFYDARIDINELSILQWANLAIEYAEENGYVLDDLAKLALHAKINEKNLPTTRLGYADVLDMMDEAMEKANKRSVGRLFGAFRRNANAPKEIIESDFD